MANSHVLALIISNAPRAVFLIRLSVGAVFFPEGTQKLLFHEQVGVGRFTRIYYTAFGPWLTNRMILR
jgi:hypothetical protein